MPRQKVLLDTDIGSDIDDAVCLAYLLAQPQCDLLGITTVTGEPVARARLASALCRQAGRDDVPIYPGLATPMLVPQMQQQAPQAAALARWDHRHDFPVGQAITFLRDTIRAHPGEVTLLAIGPLTNLGVLFALDPELPGLLRQLVLMCGHFFNRAAGWGPREWNAFGDPHASAIVYQRSVACHRSIGTDVTSRVQLPAAEVRRRFQTPLLLPVLDFAEVWFQHQEKITFHDPLAAATIFADHLCQYQRGQVEIELTSPKLAGLTHWRPDPAGPHEVATEVDAERFFSHYFGVVGSGG